MYVNLVHITIIFVSLKKVNTKDIIEEVNDKHMTPWAELCQNHRVENTPLSPFMHEEQLFHNHLNLDNKKLKQTGYNLRFPIMTKELVEEIITDYAEENLFPLPLHLNAPSEEEEYGGESSKSLK